MSSSVAELSELRDTVCMKYRSLGRLIGCEGEIPQELNEKAKTHVPRVDIESPVKKGESASIRIILTEHPSRTDHHIEFLDVYYEEDGRPFNPIRVAHVRLTPEIAEPYVEIRIRPRVSGWLHVVAYCNMHGLWEAVRRVEVKD